MSTGQNHRFAYAAADDTAKAALLKALAPTAMVTVERNLHPAFSHHRQVHTGVVQSGRDLCRT